MTTAPTMASEIPETDEATAGARFARLYGICRRLRWSEFGVPSRETEGSKQALEDLCEFLFMDGIDRAIRRDNPNETEQGNG